MKHTCSIFIIFLFSGCLKNSVKFTGLTPGIKSGVFIIKTTGDSTIIGENIKDGKFAIPKKQLKEPGYYLMKITDDDNKDNREPNEIYLDNGEYTIETKPGQLYLYPKITSSSPIQNQLSAFYTLSDSLNAGTNLELGKLKEQLKAKGDKANSNEYIKLINNVSAAEIKLVDNDATAFKQFIKLYPQSEISCHLLSKLNYEDDPVAYYAIYKTLSPAAKNTDEGKEIDDKLSHLANLVAGAKAPAIAGQTPEGKVFDPKSLTKGFIIIDFWRASDDISRINHQKLVSLVQQEPFKDKLDIVSVSLDTKRDWWTNAIHGDDLTWQQVSDLKGDDSPNATNWAITKIPTYYLLDKNWTILERDMDIRNVDLTVSDHIKNGR